MKLQGTLFFFLVFVLSAGANDTTRLKIPLVRQHFHDKILKEQVLIDSSDGKKDGRLSAGDDSIVIEYNSRALFEMVDSLRIGVERNVELPSNNDKVRYLRYIEGLLNRFRMACRSREIRPVCFGELFDAFRQMYYAIQKNETVLPYLSSTSFEVTTLLGNLFSDHPESREIKKMAYVKYCRLHPEKILETIGPYENDFFADSLIITASRLDPVDLYSYAQSRNTAQGRIIHRSKDAMVSTLADISQIPNALLYFPFLDDIITGRNTIEEIHRYIGNGEDGYDSVGYFKLLVRTAIEYHRRMVSPAKDTPVALLGPNGLREMIQVKALQHFIHPINELHAETNLALRMRALDPLTAEEIYYMIVMGEHDIYTSSFKHSFNRLLQRMGPVSRGDSLLMRVHHDYFRKFIKMVANYNRLDTFLKTMPKEASASLMNAFVSHLDESANLEDAVDVADAFSSIADTGLLKFIINTIKINEQKALEQDNKRGVLIYGILKNIFLSSDSSNGIDLSDMYGIPSIFEVRPADLQDDSGRIIQQVFFYGDEDGKNMFQPFLNSFSSKEWTITNKKEWIEIKSIRGKVWIYANKPLDYDQNLDDSAQINLGAYLESNNMVPAVIVHRGHSYWLPATIRRMPGNAKIVVLGSCGGYKNLNKILAENPDAHIISTKEIGTGEINRPILNYLNQYMLSGQYIQWKTMWSVLKATFARDPSKEIYESWQNYIPPHRNLGAIFIKVYNKIAETP